MLTTKDINLLDSLSGKDAALLLFGKHLKGKISLKKYKEMMDYKSGVAEQRFRFKEAPEVDRPIRMPYNDNTT